MFLSSLLTGSDVVQKPHFVQSKSTAWPRTTAIKHNHNHFHVSPRSFSDLPNILPASTRHNARIRLQHQSPQTLPNPSTYTPLASLPKMPTEIAGIRCQICGITPVGCSSLWHQKTGQSAAQNSTLGKVFTFCTTANSASMATQIALYPWIRVLKGCFLRAAGEHRACVICFRPGCVGDGQMSSSIRHVESVVGFMLC